MAPKIIIKEHHMPKKDKAKPKVETTQPEFKTNESVQKKASKYATGSKQGGNWMRSDLGPASPLLFQQEANCSYKTPGYDTNQSPVTVTAVEEKETFSYNEDDFPPLEI